MKSGVYNGKLRNLRTSILLPNENECKLRHKVVVGG